MTPGLKKVCGGLVNCRLANNTPTEHWIMRSELTVRLLLVALTLWVLPASGEEQLEQETISIKGNRGLPKTLYIAPWKRVGVPLESEGLEGDVGEESEPVERDMFQRELELQRQGYSVD